MPTGHRDSGLPTERTRLAWRRTALSLTAVVLLDVRLAMPYGAPGAVLAAVAVAGWAVLVVLGYRRVRALASAHLDSALRAMPLAAIATVLYAALGALLVALPLG